MVTDVKSVKILGGCNFRKSKNLRFFRVIHNSKVVGSSPTPATISSIDSKTYVDNSLLLGLVDLNDESFIHSAHVGRKLVSETVGLATPRS